MQCATHLKISTLLFGCILFFACPVSGDDFENILRFAKADGHVEILVSHWRPVSGEIDIKDLSSAITGTADLNSETSQLMDHIQRIGGQATSLRHFKYLNLSAISVDLKGLNAAKSYEKNGNIWANNIIHIDLANSGPAIGAPEFWNKGDKGKGQIVAVIDSGVDKNHPFLQGRISGEACFAINCPNGHEVMIGEGAASPVESHGTHVSGIIAGSNSLMQGVAPEASILAINVFGLQDGFVGSRDIDILSALDYVAELKIEHHMPIAAVNLSLGGGPFSSKVCDDTPYQEIAQILEAAGVAVVASAGNSNVKTGLQNPACSSSVISVGAIENSGNIAIFSNSASFMDIWAPGVEILSSSWQANNNGSYETLSGTSMSAPHVAGAFALLREAYPELSVRQLLKKLQSGPIIHDPANNTYIPALFLVPENDLIHQKKPNDKQTPKNEAQAITG